MIWDHLDPDDHRKAKKSLLIVASVTIAIASIEFTSDEITLLEFSVRVPQAKLLAAGQLLSFLLFIVFMLHALPVYVGSIAEIWKKAQEAKHARETIHLQNDWGFEDFPDFSDGPEGEFQALDYKQSKERQVLTEKVNFVSIVAKSISVLVIDYSIPILVGLVAFFQPEWPSQVMLVNNGNALYASPNG